MRSTPFQGPVDSASWGLPHSLHAHRQGLAPVQGPAAELRHVGPCPPCLGADVQLGSPTTGNQTTDAAVSDGDKHSDEG